MRMKDNICIYNDNFVLVSEKCYILCEMNEEI